MQYPTWLATAVTSPERAAQEAMIWWTTPYPLFKRLAFFAATQGDVIDNRRALDWILSDDHWWLWSLETERESTRLLIALAEKVEPAMFLELEQAILAGPPSTMFDGDTDPERLARILDREIWERLAKVAGAGATLSPVGQQRLDALGEAPFWLDGNDGALQSSRNPTSLPVPETSQGAFTK